jgi:hypothetical protein
VNHPHYVAKKHHPRVKRIVRREPVVVKKTVVHVVEDEDGVPYGFMKGGKIRSPWSEFTMSVGGKVSGQIVYDPHTGQPFRVP